MKIKFPLITVTKVISGNRHCSICGDGTPADMEISFKTGYNSASSIAYCNNHKNQLIANIKELEE